MAEDAFAVGIVGLGGVSLAHLHAIELLPQVDIVSVCDLNDEVAGQVAESYRARSFPDYRQLLDYGNIDLVLVLTPASTHREIVEYAAESGIDVFCEKPLAVSVSDAESMVTACNEANIKFFYGSCYRYLPAVREAFRLVRSGAIGDIRLLTEQMVGGEGIAGYEELSHVHYPKYGPGGANSGMMDHGIHLIDIFSWIADAEVCDVQCAIQQSGSPPACEFMVMRFANGAVGHLVYDSATFSTRLPNEGMFSGGQGWLVDGSLSTVGVWESEPGSISVYGTEGALRICHYINALFLNNADGLKQIHLNGRPAFGHFATQLEDCIKSIRQDSPPIVSGADGVRALAVLLSRWPRGRGGLEARRTPDPSELEQENGRPLKIV